MALTVTTLRSRALSDDFYHGLVKGQAEITFDSSYPTGGEAITPANLGLTAKILGIIGMAHDADANLYVLRYDIDNSKLLVENSGAQVANATDLSALTFHVEYYGC